MHTAPNYLAAGGVALALGFGALGVGGPSGPARQQPTSMRSVEPASFAGEIGSKTYSYWLENDLALYGSVYVGPVVVLEGATQRFPAGARVVPVAYTGLLTRATQLETSVDGMFLRAADDSTPPVFHIDQSSFAATLSAAPVADLTWAEVDHEDEIEITLELRGNSEQPLPKPTDRSGD